MIPIRLGSRTDEKTPLIKDFVPLVGLEDLVFGTWDPISDDGYESAVKAGVLDKSIHLEPIKDFLSSIQPMKASFSAQYVKKLDGPNKKSGNKREQAEELRQDIRRFKKQEGCDRLVMIWCGSTEIFLRSGAAHETIGSFEKAMEDDDESIAPSLSLIHISEPTRPY